MGCKYCKADCVHRGEDREKECKGNVPMTNADRIRAMSDEELAMFLCSVYDEDDGITDEHGAKFICGITILDYDEDKILEWLRQPAEEYHV